jgi:hypothetical protein
MNKLKELYETQDLGFASFLIACGRYVLVEIKSNSQFKKTFVFSPKPSEKVILDFYSGVEKVPAIKLIESYQRLKSATYMVGNNKEV